MNLSALLKEYAQPATPTSGLAGYGSSRSAAEKKRAKKKRIVDLRAWMAKGDVEGHEFHGNQWTGGQGATELAAAIGAPSHASVHEGGGSHGGGTVSWSEAKSHADAHAALLRAGFMRDTLKSATDRQKMGRSTAYTSSKVKESTYTHPAGHTASVKTSTAKYGDIATRSYVNINLKKLEAAKLLKQQLTDRAAHQAATSYLNLLPQPTEAQRHAGNYPKGHVSVGGLDVSIENPAGSHRRPEWPELRSHYGYIRRTEGADGEHVDCFVRVGTPEDYSGPVHVIDQHVGGEYDEHKCMIGWENADEARTAYLENYERGWPGIGGFTTLTMDDFKAWLAEGDTTKPLSGSSTLSRLLLSTIRRSA